MSEAPEKIERIAADIVIAMVTAGGYIRKSNVADETVDNVAQAYKTIYKAIDQPDQE